MERVFVVMDQWRNDDDGNWDRDIVSIHASRDGAVAACQEPEQYRELYVIEMDLER